MSTRIYKSALDQLGDGKAYKVAGEISDYSQFKASMVTVNDVTSIKALTVLEEVLGIARPQYTLTNACRVIPTDTLEFSVDTATKLTAAEDVPDLVEADLVKNQYTRTAFDLLPNVVHVAMSGKAQKQSVHNLMGIAIEDAAGALAKSKNTQIKTVLESTTRTSPGGNWLSTDNPYEDIDTAVDAIEVTYEAGVANTLAAPRKVWTAFWSNPFVKGQLQGAAFPTTRVFSVPGLPGFTGIMDSAMTAETMVVCDRNQYAFLAQGPVEAESYRNAKGNYDAWIIRDWKQCKKVVNDAGYKLTGILSAEN